MSAKLQRSVRRRGRSAKLSPNKSSCFLFESEKVDVNSPLISLKDNVIKNDKDSLNEPVLNTLLKASDVLNVPKKKVPEKKISTNDNGNSSEHKAQKTRKRKVRATMNSLFSPWIQEASSNAKMKPKKIKKKQLNIFTFQVDDILEDQKAGKNSSTENKENDTTDTENEYKPNRKRNIHKKKGKAANYDNIDSQESDVNYYSVEGEGRSKPKKSRRKRIKHKTSRNSSDTSTSNSLSDSKKSLEMTKSISHMEPSIDKKLASGRKSSKRGTFEIKRDNSINKTNSVEFQTNSKSKLSTKQNNLIITEKNTSPGSDNVFTDSGTSVEVSFKKKSGRRSDILDHLNVTRLELRKSSFKKSSRGFSTGSDDESNKMRFITVRKGYKTLTDWNMDATSKTVSVYQEKGKQSDEPMLKINEQSSLAQSLPIPGDLQQGQTMLLSPGQDGLKEMVLNGSDMIDNVNSLVLDNSFANSNYLPLKRDSTFIKNTTVDYSSPQPRKSMRKRWSQVERTPIFNANTNVQKSPFVDSPKSSFLKKSHGKKSKSVLIITPPKNLEEDIIELASFTKRPELKRPKSVKIESPSVTPKVRLHSPLVARKTPRVPSGMITDSTFISGSNLFTKVGPPSGTSTPYHKKDGGLLKKVLTSENNKNDSFPNKSAKRIKMPNFEKIHQRQFEKMENLEELQRRKAVRAQFLLSGSKPPAPKSEVSEIGEKESRKKLQFAPANKPQVSTNSIKETASKTISKPIQNMLKKRASLEKKKKEMKSKVPVSISNHSGPSAPTNKALTRFGFKLQDKQRVTKQEQIEAITKKSKVAPNRREEVRKQLQGVRSNRRFELLMKMRLGQK